MVIRGCIGDGIDHFRFDLMRLATAHLGKGDAEGKQLPLRVGTFGFMTLFFDDAHPSIPEPRQKEIGGKTWSMQKGERIVARTTAVNCDGFYR